MRTSASEDVEKDEPYLLWQGCSFGTAARMSVWGVYYETKNSYLVTRLHYSWVNTQQLRSYFRSICTLTLLAPLYQGNGTGLDGHQREGE